MTGRNVDYRTGLYEEQERKTNFEMAGEKSFMSLDHFMDRFKLIYSCHPSIEVSLIYTSV